jgi:fructokinase
MIGLGDERIEMKPLLGAIEAGGTDFVCAVAEEAGTRFIARRVISTTDPTETLAAAIQFLSGHQLSALGVACFGPIDLDRGMITTTPKAGWRQTEIVRPLRDVLRVPVGFDTDVSGAALGEGRHGAGRGRDPLIYVTVGTGIGAGILVNGRLLHGAMHPEAGHISVRRRPDDDLAGVCPFHRDCLEGLASGPAIEARWGSPGRDLPDGHPAWDLEAHYLADALCSLLFMVSPRRIVLGGGVMRRLELLEHIREGMLARLGGYLAPLNSAEAIEDLIVPAELGDDAGIVGALELAQEALSGSVGRLP